MESNHGVKNVLGLLRTNVEDTGCVPEPETNAEFRAELQGLLAAGKLSEDKCAALYSEYVAGGYAGAAN